MSYKPITNCGNSYCKGESSNLNLNAKLRTQTGIQICGLLGQRVRENRAESLSQRGVLGSKI